MRRPKRLLLIGNESDRGREVSKGVIGFFRLNGRWEYRLEKDLGPTMGREIKAAIEEWKPDGIIGPMWDERLEQLVLDSGIPVVSVAGESELPTVLPDEVGTGRLVARHFLDNGLRNFVYYTKTQAHFSQKRCDGFVAELAAAGFGCEVFTDMKIHSVAGHANSDRHRWLLSIKKPLAIMCAHDARAHEISLACHRLGIRVPDEVALVGVGNDELFCQLINPPLSSVDQDLQRVGHVAARLLHRILRGAKAPSKPILVPPRRVVIRQSSDIISVNDPEVAAALRFIREHAHEPICVKEILQKVPISRKTMERRFEHLIGRSPGEEILRIRIDRSKSLLEETEFSMSAIARSTGFSRRAFFSTFFLRKTGLTPTQYRQNHRLDSSVSQVK